MSTQRVALPGRGVEIEVEWHGPRQGRVFALVHGFTGSRDDWAEQLPWLAGLGPTLAWDQRGHGGSTNLGDPDLYSVEALVDDGAATLTQLGIEACDLLGHSMGGAMALRFALAHPGRVRSLVLMDTGDRALGIADEDAFRKMSELARNAGASVLTDVMRRRAAEDPQRPASMRKCEARMGPDRYWERIRAKHAAMDPAAMLGLGRALVRLEAVSERLSEIRCPTLVIVGAEDRPFLRSSERMAERIPDAELVVIPDAAHSPQLENSEAWHAAIAGFLRRVRS